MHWTTPLQIIVLTILYIYTGKCPQFFILLKLEGGRRGKKFYWGGNRGCKTFYCWAIAPPKPPRRSYATDKKRLPTVCTASRLNVMSLPVDCVLHCE